ncbi:mitotic spindle assembly checkpoint protein MAD2A-like [Elephas maximus indicus]|uniref:mitotic spindle assembly checkpoint protein MAD2A-like n=1 Tax=Elephas maximus indicus TaxID=99487 RepID=UPI00211707CA|nr:mitotic spindle assembly checkpoint protein MAD2A-like [Elephas maximus indicus]
MALQLTREQGVTLRGSAEIVAEFFSFYISVAYIHLKPLPECENMNSTLLVTADPELIKYLNNLVDQLKARAESQKTIQDEIRSVIRQITATVTFLPLLGVSCSFDLLIYTDEDLVVPEKWEESGPQFIISSEEVRLRSFTTTIHKAIGPKHTKTRKS